MVKLKHSSGVVKECPTGFSWTMFFFGWFVPLFRGDIKWAAFLLVATILTAVPTNGLGGFIVGMVACFWYNKTYIKDLLQKGYSAYSQDDQKWLVEHGIVDGTVSEIRNEVKPVKKKGLVKVKKSKSSGNANVAGAIAGAVAGAVVSGLNKKGNAEDQHVYTVVENENLSEQQEENFQENVCENLEEGNTDDAAECVATNQEDTDANQEEYQDSETEEDIDDEETEDDEIEDVDDEEYEEDNGDDYDDYDDD